MEEGLLTQNEINEILEEAKKPEWLNPNLMNLLTRRLDIFRISQITGVILIVGDEFTGTLHIQHRHRFGRQVWREDKDELNDSSELRFGIAPYDYLRIAESIYKPENKRESKNPDSLDLYVGKHVFKNGDAIEHRLVTYKDTGIVHTLYPTKSDNRTRKIPYRQCAIKMTGDFRKARFMYEIPYKDKADREVFSIIVLGLRAYPLERWYIKVGEGNEVPPQTVFIKELVCNLSIDHGEIRAIIPSDSIKPDAERIAMEILRGKYDLNKGELLHTLSTRNPIYPPPTYFAW